MAIVVDYCRTVIDDGTVCEQERIKQESAK